jgi:serine/threonine-protein kinase RsbW
MCSEPAAHRSSGGMNLLFRLSFCVPGHVRSISPIVEGVMVVARETECAAGKEFEIELALEEALVNAILHGCGNDASKMVECSVSSSESGQVTIVVRDPGPGFDPASIPTPVEGENLYSNHGRGIFLITRLMDEVWFERGGTEIHMRKS